VALWKDKGVSPSAEGDRRSRRLRRAFEKARAKLSIRHRRDAPINCNLMFRLNSYISIFGVAFSACPRVCVAYNNTRDREKNVYFVLFCSILFSIYSLSILISSICLKHPRRGGFKRGLRRCLKRGLRRCLKRRLRGASRGAINRLLAYNAKKPYFTRVLLTLFFNLM